MKDVAGAKGTKVTESTEVGKHGDRQQQGQRAKVIMVRQIELIGSNFGSCTASARQFLLESKLYNIDLHSHIQRAARKAGAPESLLEVLENDLRGELDLPY